MDNLTYQRIGIVNGCWKADLIESFLKAEGIDVELIQDAMTHYMNRSAFDPVQVYVVNNQVSEALELLESFEEFLPEEDDDE